MNPLNPYPYGKAGKKQSCKKTDRYYYKFTNFNSVPNKV